MLHLYSFTHQEHSKNSSGGGSGYGTTSLANGFGSVNSMKSRMIGVFHGNANLPGNNSERRGGNRIGNKQMPQHIPDQHLGHQHNTRQHPQQHHHFSASLNSSATGGSRPGMEQLHAGRRTKGGRGPADHPTTTRWNGAYPSTDQGAVERSRADAARFKSADGGCGPRNNKVGSGSVAASETAPVPANAPPNTEGGLHSRHTDSSSSNNFDPKNNPNKQQLGFPHLQPVSVNDLTSEAAASKSTSHDNVSSSSVVAPPVASEFLSQFTAPRSPNRVAPAAAAAPCHPSVINSVRYRSDPKDAAPEYLAEPPTVAKTPASDTTDPANVFPLYVIIDGSAFLEMRELRKGGQIVPFSLPGLLSLCCKNALAVPSDRLSTTDPPTKDQHMVILVIGAAFEEVDEIAQSHPLLVQRFKECQVDFVDELMSYGVMEQVPMAHEHIFQGSFGEAARNRARNLGLSRHVVSIFDFANIWLHNLNSLWCPLSHESRPMTVVVTGNPNVVKFHSSLTAGRVSSGEPAVQCIELDSLNRQLRSHYPALVDILSRPGLLERKRDPRYGDKPILTSSALQALIEHECRSRPVPTNMAASPHPTVPPAISPDAPGRTPPRVAADTTGPKDDSKLQPVEHQPPWVGVQKVPAPSSFDMAAVFGRGPGSRSNGFPLDTGNAAGNSLSQNPLLPAGSVPDNPMKMPYHADRDRVCAPTALESLIGSFHMPRLYHHHETTPRINEDPAIFGAGPATLPQHPLPSVAPFVGTYNQRNAESLGFPSINGMLANALSVDQVDREVLLEAGYRPEHLRRSSDGLAGPHSQSNSNSYNTDRPVEERRQLMEAAVIKEPQQSFHGLPPHLLCSPSDMLPSDAPTETLNLPPSAPLDDPLRNQQHSNGVAGENYSRFSMYMEQTLGTLNRASHPHMYRSAKPAAELVRLGGVGEHGLDLHRQAVPPLRRAAPDPLYGAPYGVTDDAALPILAHDSESAKKILALEAEVEGLRMMLASFQCKEPTPDGEEGRSLCG